MDRLIHKEKDGDLTCHARDFDQVFHRLYAYEETGLTPEQVSKLQGELVQAKLDLAAAMADIKHGEDNCPVCKFNPDFRSCHGECDTCKKKCNCYSCKNESNWTWRGVREE